ncbi:SH3 domain-containing protein, partial [uncultured Senegalimassilia sp.]
RAARRGINYRLVENGFIDSDVDLAYFNEHVDDIARVYLEVFGITASSAPSEPESGASGPGSTGFEGGTYRCTVDTLNVRDAPGLSGSVVAKYHKGQTVVLDDWYKSRDGYVWGRYTGASSGKERYVAVGRATGKPEADDYLVRVG